MPLDPLRFVLLHADDSRVKLCGLPVVRLAPANDECVRFGLGVRERYEHYDNIGLGLLKTPGRQDYLLWRILADVDFHAGEAFRVFGQLGCHDDPGKTQAMAPVNQDRWDLQQTFAGTRF